MKAEMRVTATLIIRFFSLGPSKKKKVKSGRFIFHVNRLVDDISVGKYIGESLCVVHVVDMIILTRHAISVWCWCHLENGEK